MGAILTLALALKRHKIYKQDVEGTNKGSIQADSRSTWFSVKRLVYGV